MNDYERIARVIQYLDEHHREQPSLEVLAEQVGLSPFHFHRLFSAWAGITPKEFLRCLTLNHAKALLRQGESVLDAALSAGLSGPGRLHDLCVALEAATPGEIKSRGEGCEIRFGFGPTPFGPWMAAETSRGVCHIEFAEEDTSDEALTSLRQSWPRAELRQDDSVAERLATLIFENPKPQASRPTLRAFVRGTEFQVRVWRALLGVPCGVLVSYGRLAGMVGHPKASRAVGSAVGDNPLACLIPCHRVIRETGVVKGYRWGDTRKRALIAWESARTTHAQGRLSWDRQLVASQV